MRRLQDGSGRIQLYVTRDALGEDAYAAFKHWDLGDILGAEGTLFKSNKGEFSVRVTKLRLLTKSLRPLPDKFHGMADQEQKYRQRYVDLITDEDARQRFVARSKAVSSIRNFMVEHGFLEVETPMLHAIPGGANAKPFATHHNALDQQMFLRIAPELYLKRLVVGGFERVFEINRNFRNEGISVRHNPEFTMMEFYAAYWNHHDLMDFTEGVLRHAARQATGSASLTYAGRAGGPGQAIRASVGHRFAGGACRPEPRRGHRCHTAARQAEGAGRRTAHALDARRVAVRLVRGGGGRKALGPDVHHRLPRGGVAARAGVRHQPGGHRAVRALHHRARVCERILGTERRRGPGGALSGPGCEQGSG